MGTSRHRLREMRCLLTGTYILRKLRRINNAVTKAVRVAAVLAPVLLCTATSIFLPRLLSGCKDQVRLDRIRQCPIDVLGGEST